MVLQALWRFEELLGSTFLDFFGADVAGKIHFYPAKSAPKLKVQNFFQMPVGSGSCSGIQGSVSGYAPLVFSCCTRPIAPFIGCIW